MWKSNHRTFNHQAWEAIALWNVMRWRFMGIVDELHAPATIGQPSNL